jgi:hypothetical protein
MKTLKIIRRRKGRTFEVAEFDSESLEPVEIYKSLASFGSYQDALDFKLKKLLDLKPIDFAIDTEPGKETR